MLANLVDNALKYTPSNGKVWLDAEDVENTVQIKISDTGMGIPAEDQDRIFERFYRCDQSRNSDGFGLGLSFAQAVAHAHGGQIQLNSEPGKSSTFTIILPTP